MLKRPISPLSLPNRNTLQKIEALKADVQSYHTLSPRQLMNVKEKLFTETLYHSYLDKANHLSLEKLEELIFKDRVDGSILFSDYQVIYRKIKTLLYIEKEANNPSNFLTLQFIHKIYLLLFWEDEIIKNGSFALPYRDTIAVVDEQTLNLTPSPISQIPKLLEKLIHSFIEQKNDESIFILAAHFQYHFIEISPFQKGNKEFSFYLFHFLIMNEGYPPIIFPSDKRSEHYEAIKNASRDNFQALYEIVLKGAVTSLEHLLELLKRMKNKSEISPGGNFSSLIKGMQSSEKEVTRFKVQKTVSEKEVTDILTAIKQISNHYFLDNPPDELTITQRTISIREVMHSITLKDFFMKHSITPLWKLNPHPKDSYYTDLVDSVYGITLSSKLLYIPNSIIYFGVIPCREGNYIFSVLISTYMDFKREERFSKNLSFFRCKKGGIRLEDWDNDSLILFFDQSMKEFYEQLTEKVIERKRILKKG